MLEMILKTGTLPPPPPPFSGIVTITQLAPTGLADSFGGSVALNQKGDVCGVIAHLGAKAYVMTRTTGGWQLTQLPCPSANAVGKYISLNAEGNICVVSSGSSTVGINVCTNVSGVWGYVKIAGTVDGIVDTNAAGDIIVQGKALSNIAYIFTNTAGVWSKIQLPNQGATNFGSGVSINAAGNICAVSSSNRSVVYIFENISQIWTLTATLVPGETVSQFGLSVDLNAAGDVCVVGSGVGGKAYIFKNTGAGNWAGEMLPISAGKYFSAPVAINDDGDVCIIGTQSGGHFYIFRKSQDSWVPKRVEPVPTPTTLGRSVAINGDGDLCAIGAPNANTVVFAE